MSNWMDWISRLRVGSSRYIRTLKQGSGQLAPTCAAGAATVSKTICAARPGSAARRRPSRDERSDACAVSSGE
jgi:hypothetical protein